MYLADLMEDVVTSCWGELPPEIWERILSHVVANDVHNENGDDTTHSRLVCKSWESLIDGVIRQPHHHQSIPTWNPYFDDSSYGFAGGFAGTHFSQRSDVEEFLAEWAAVPDPSPNPFVAETLSVKWKWRKSDQDYAEVMELLPTVFDQYGNFIRRLVLHFDPLLEASVSCLLMIFQKLVNLRSVSIYVGGRRSGGGGGSSEGASSSSWLLTDDESSSSVLSRIQPDCLEHLTELQLLGDPWDHPRAEIKRLFQLFCHAAGSSRVKTLRVGLRNLPVSTLTEFTAVDTLKACGAFLSEDGARMRRSGFRFHIPSDKNPILYWNGEHGSKVEAIESLRRLRWNIRRLSLRIVAAATNGVTTSTLCQLFCRIHELDREEGLQEFYLDFRKKDLEPPSAHLGDRNRRRGHEVALGRLSQISFNNLTTLSLPYFMTSEPHWRSVLGKLAERALQLAQLKLVYVMAEEEEEELLQQEGHEAGFRKDEVEQAVSQTWAQLPPWVKLLSVIFRRQMITKESVNKGRRRRRFMSNVVWKFERPTKQGVRS